MKYEHIRSGLRLLAAVAVVSVGTMLAPVAWAQGGSAANANMQRMDGLIPGHTDDMDFLKTALQADMGEIQLAQLAVQKASSNDVKQLAQHLLDDHTKIDDELSGKAKEFGVHLEKDISKKDRQTLSKLQGLSGEPFDDNYIVATAKDHKKSGDDFKDEAASTKDPTLKAIVQRDYDILRQHLQMIDQTLESHHLAKAKS